MAFNSNTHGKLILAIIVIILIVVMVFVVREGSVSPAQAPVAQVDVLTPSPTPREEPVTYSTPIAPPVVIVTGLKIPWDLAFLPGGALLVTEREGNLVQIEKDGTKTSIKLPHPVPKGEGGLLGIVLHPKFSENKLLYLYMTTQGTTGGTKNAVFRYKYEDGKLLDEKTIIANIPGAIYHDGGRMEFGPDGYLYITTGDATIAAIAQDLKSLGGKILRLTDDGTVPGDNPFGTVVYSYGHRNPQGLAWDDKGNLWSTEHGRSGVTTGMDELNLIEKGKNYGWPTIEGDATKEGMITPVLNSGPKTTWAPASLLYLNGKLFFGGLLGQSLYEAEIEGDHVDHLDVHFEKEYGRIRTLRLGPDGMIYMTTSNRDGRGKPIAEDDRIIKIDPRFLVH